MNAPTLDTPTGATAIEADYPRRRRVRRSDSEGSHRGKLRHTAEEIKQAVATLPPRTVRRWASLFRVSESTMHRVIKKHRIRVRLPATKKEQIVTTLALAVRCGLKKTAEEWARELGVCETYIPRIAEWSRLTAAVRPRWMQLEGTLATTPIGGGYSRVVITTRILELAGLQGEAEVSFVIDQEKRQIILKPGAAPLPPWQERAIRDKKSGVLPPGGGQTEA